MLTIRLQRVGKKNQAAFRIVVADKLRAPEKKIVENLGFYNPRTKEFGIKDETRLQYWISQHVEISPTANNLLVSKGMLTGDKVKAWRPKAKAKAEVPAEAGIQPVTPAQAGVQSAPAPKAEEPKPEPEMPRTA